MSAIVSSVPVGAGNSSASIPSDSARLSSAAKEFESVLLGQWLKDAESAFGSIPGGQDEDAGGEQMSEFAMQHVAAEITDRGGIGIAQIVERALVKQEMRNPSQREGERR